MLSYGFRPFFFPGSIWVGIEVLVWMPTFDGELSLATTISPRDCHVYELLSGFVPAIVAGFLLTAIPNWTGRLPLQGLPLAGLVLVWLAGRYAISLPAGIGWLGSTVVDCALLILMAAAGAREIVASKNWKKPQDARPLCLLAAGNLGFHLEAHFEASRSLHPASASWPCLS